MIKLLLFVSGCIFSSLAFCQQLPSHAQYLFNLQAVNAAYSGSNQTIYANVNHHAQWVGFDGAPQQSEIYFHSSLPKKAISIGFQALHETVGAHRVSGASASATYHLKLNRKNDKLSFALRMGGYQYGFDVNKLTIKDAVDPNLNLAGYTKWYPKIDAAVFLRNDRSYIGFEANQLYNAKFSPTEESDSRLTPHFYLVGGHAFRINQDWDFKPSLLITYVHNVPVLPELNATFLYKKRIWMGVGYQYDVGINAVAQFLIDDKFAVGYSYGYPVNNLAQTQSGTHEISLTFETSLFKSIVTSPRFF